ncbi:MAG: amino acid permease [Burkholderiaceae bacterium]|nr:amino acid permease [Burkholderiaceae bacterium]
MNSADAKMSLWGAMALAIGTMIGASIFSIFGLGARLAGRNLPWVFLVSGLLALLVAHSYATLGRRIVSDAGPVAFVLAGYGDGILTGALSILFWLTYVISIALFAKGLAGYLLPLLHLPANGATRDLVATLVVLAFMLLGLLGSASVGRAETLIVIVKLAILGVFVFFGLATVRVSQLAPALDPSGLRGSLTAVSVFFLSYMGFGLVTNASEHLRDPVRNVPRAIYLSILVVTIVYVSVSVVAVGNLTSVALARAQDNALAVAAEPFLGRTGFLLVSVGALFSIASALNATLYGGANVAFALARDGELPRVFERKLWLGSSLGLYLTAAIGIAFAVSFDLGSIASLTSSVIMCLYLAVLASHWRLRHEYGGSAAVIAIGLVGVAAVFAGLMVHQWQTSRTGFATVWAVLLGSVLLEWIYRSRTGRRFVQHGLTVLSQDVAALERKLGAER